MLSIRDRLFAFPAVAAPALVAWLLGRWLAGIGSLIEESGASRGTGRHLSEWTVRFLGFAIPGEAHAAPFQTFGNWSAIVISVTGFLIVHRLRPDHAFRALIFHLSISWALQAITLILAVLALSDLLGRHG